MAVYFDSTADIIGATSGGAVAGNVESRTICGLARIETNSSSATQLICGFSNSQSYFSVRLDWRRSSNDSMYLYCQNGSGGTSPVTFASRPAVGELFFWYVKCSGTGSNAVEAGWGYLDGSAMVTATNTLVSGSSGSCQLMTVGGELSSYVRGQIAGVRQWTTALSAAELENERYQISANRRADLIGEYPFWDVATSLTDFSGNGATLSNISGFGGTAPSDTAISFPVRIAGRRAGRAVVVSAATGVSGTLSKTLGTLTGAGTGTVAVSGSLSKTLGALSAAGAGTVAVSGNLAKTLGALAVAGAGGVAVDGAGAATLGDLTAAGAGTVIDPGAEGTLNQTLGALSAAGSGTVGVDGSLSKTLDAATVIGTGTVDVAGAGAVTLGALVSAGAGAVAVDGAASITLGDLALAGTGSVVSGIDGTLNKTLGELAAAGTGAVTVEGALAVTLGELALSAAGESSIEGSLNKTLGQLVAAGVGDNGEVSAAADGGYLLAWRRWPRR